MNQNNNYNNSYQNNNNSYDNFRPPQSTLGQQPRLGDNFMTGGGVPMGGNNNYNNSGNNWGPTGGQGGNDYNNTNNFGNTNAMGGGAGYANPFQQTNGFNNSINDRQMGNNLNLQQPNYNNQNISNIPNNDPYNRGNPNMQGGMYGDNYGQNNNWGNSNQTNNMGPGMGMNVGGAGPGLGMGGLNQNEMQQFDMIMRRASNFTKTGNHINLDSFFLPYDCYQGRFIETWELPIIFSILMPDEENIMIRGLGDFQNTGRIDFTALAKQLQVITWLILQQVRQGSVYQDKIRNISIPLSRFELIAKQVLESDRLGTYRAAFEKSQLRKTTITVDDLTFIINQAGIFTDRNEIQQIFNYFVLDNQKQINKIQFVQGFKAILPESNALLAVGRQDGGFGAGMGVGMNARQDANQLTPEQTRYIKLSLKIMIHVYLHKILEGYSITHQSIQCSFDQATDRYWSPR